MEESVKIRARRGASPRTQQLPTDILDRGEDGVLRCWWGGSTPEYQQYHDREWGRPTFAARTLFEKLCLEGFQAG